VVRASVLGWLTFPDLRLIYGWHVTTSWVKWPLWLNQPGQLKSCLFGRWSESAHTGSACTPALSTIQKLMKMKLLYADCGAIQVFYACSFAYNHLAVSTAQSLLHSRQKVMYDASECADHVGKFSSLFVDKVRRIRDNMASALQQSSPRMFAARPHTGRELSVFQPVTIDEVQKLLASIPRKTSPLDVLPVSLLKDCVEVFAPAITTLANLSLQTGKFPARFKSAQVLPLLKKAGLDRSLTANYRPISNLSTVSILQGARDTCAGTSASPPHQLQELQQVAVGLQERTVDRDGAARCPWQRPHCG